VGARRGGSSGLPDPRRLTRHQNLGVHLVRHAERGILYSRASIWLGVITLAMWMLTVSSCVKATW